MGTKTITAEGLSLAPTRLSDSAPALVGVELAPGVVVDERYRLERVIGRGGMGEVWSARHLFLARDVAVKFVVVPTDELKSRLLREAQIVASLRHPAIVEIHDCGVFGGRPFLVMELLRGETLAERLARVGRLEPRTAIRLLRPVLDGLALVHERGIVHRDVKPANVLLVAQKDGEPSAKLLDFGIASHGPDAGGGGIVGTPSYMAPEQISGDALGPATDVWAFSVTLYEAITGRAPFPDDGGPAKTALRVLREPLPYPRWCPVDPLVWRFLADGTRKDVATRLPDTRVALERLGACVEAIDSNVVPPAGRPMDAAPVEPPPPSSLDALIRGKLG